MSPSLNTSTVAQPQATSNDTLSRGSQSQIIQRDSSSSRVKRLSTAVEKTVERTVDRLSKSVSGMGNIASSSSSPTSPTHRRLFSLSRQNRHKLSSGMTEEQAPSPLIKSPSSSHPTLPNVAPRNHDDSPFISPPLPLLRPSLNSFRGGGSMRVGTQTLIQALQALPWTEPDTYDEMLNHDLNSVNSEGEEEDRQNRLASSIHTIYRPVARSHRRGLPIPASRGGSALRPLPAEDTGPEELGSEEDEGEDFEDSTPRVLEKTPDAIVNQIISISQSPSNILLGYVQPSATRTSSINTVKLQRRARLAEKLRQVFELPEIEEVCAELPCWLLRSVLLQGYMYLTNSFLCFFAHMPSREDQVLKSGSLNKKAQRTKRWIKHWFVLKNDALSWYQSSSDPYFPHGIVDLRYAVSCEPVGEKDIRLRTNQKTILLSAESVPSRDEWVKALRKVIFKAQNMGDSVKIAIPYSLILDIEKSSAMDFSETIEVKVFEEEEQYSVDSYFFAYFRDMSMALDQIRDAVRAYRIRPTHGPPPAVLDTTTPRPAPGEAIDQLASQQIEPASPKANSGFRLASFLRPFSDNVSFPRPPTSPQSEAAMAEAEDFTHVSKRTDSSSFIPVTVSPVQSKETDHPSGSSAAMHQGALTAVSTSTDHTREANSSWSIGVPSWLKPSRRVFGGLTTSTAEPTPRPEVAVVREMYSSTSMTPGQTTKSNTFDLTYSILDTPDMTVDGETTEKFRAAFAYDEKEMLLGYFPGFLFRLLPIYGRLYISSNFFCFKSSGPLAARTKMTLPIRDIFTVEKSKATRFGHHGLVVIIKGHEELFFEFGAEDKRDAFVALLERQTEDVRKRHASGEASATTPVNRGGLILEEFDNRLHANDDADLSVTDNMTDSLPAVMFTSASSTFLTFKPSKPLHFTFLTIGSRGDVQPYISLAKGLMADGHRCRIATHGEFQAWIESHDIEFGFVGGDPAELMRICVENGMFTVSFLKEGIQKFRGWLDDLLKTSWEACQGTDVLIESPSAMGGYHIAEALRIPYFRAFTMTWTRTRAYPHAFAVPERKMGGSYNYMSYVMFDQVFWRATSGQINRWRRNVLQLEGTSLDKMEPHKIPFLYNFSPHIVPPPLDWPEWIRVTGYWFLEDADVSARKWTPPADLVDFIDSAHASNKKIIYIGFGSIVVSDPKSMTRCVIEAVMQSGVYAILSKGWSDRLQGKANDASEPEEPLPAQIYSISSIPHDWLFQRIDAACHHGGAGTTGASLRGKIAFSIHSDTYQTCQYSWHTNSNKTFLWRSVFLGG
ncbi:hypothetical protein AX17_000645 [Amanita inopinata Kibby_2008]|nr:hypothetical protein AX17_000645 [Amanita inopinata Kibby_2008]